MVGGLERHMLVMVVAHSIRRVDRERDIVIFLSEAPPEYVKPLAEALRIQYMVVPEADLGMLGGGRGFDQKCGPMFRGCWLKFYAWTLVQYAAVIYVDNDYILLTRQDAYFDLFAKAANTPYDVGGTADIVVGLSHPDSRDMDVFNSGWFMCIPGVEAFKRLVEHAGNPDTRWKWGEMLALNSFPGAAGGQWVRMPFGANMFPLTLWPGGPFYKYDGINWDAVSGLHYAGLSKVYLGTSRFECNKYDRDKDCTQCCHKWVSEEEWVRALSKAVHIHGLEGGGKGKGGGDGGDKDWWWNPETYDGGRKWVDPKPEPGKTIPLTGGGQPWR